MYEVELESGRVVKAHANQPKERHLVPHNSDNDQISDNEVNGSTDLKSDNEVNGSIKLESNDEVANSGDRDVPDDNSNSSEVFEDAEASSETNPPLANQS